MRATILERPRNDFLKADFEDAPRLTNGAECSNFVDLARRMAITPDDAIRQFIALGRRGPTP